MRDMEQMVILPFFDGPENARGRKPPGAEEENRWEREEHTDRRDLRIPGERLIRLRNGLRRLGADTRDLDDLIREAAGMTGAPDRGCCA